MQLGRIVTTRVQTRHAFPSLPDLWSWDVETGLWEQLPPHGTAPSPRQGAAACMAGGQLCIFGGSSNFVLGDVAMYNLEAQASSFVLGPFRANSLCCLPGWAATSAGRVRTPDGGASRAPGCLVMLH